ncbi:MAG: hypothetical protein QM691_12685 [Opitutaceae bacterium]
MPPSRPHTGQAHSAAAPAVVRNRHAIPVACVFIGALVAIWLRNRDILRDLYDYSSVIVSAGKIQAGLRPFADFRSTMQSATYALNRAVELLFGANYLALTWGGLIVSLGGAAALAWLWRRSFGWTVAAILAGAVAVSGLAQHVVVFYNPVGLLCFALVGAALAHDPRLWRVRSPEAALACVALVLGGTNKINFHALTCAQAALLVARGWLLRECSARGALASAGMLALCGVVLPLGLELAWTGATLQQWIDNVLLLPSERVGFVAEFLRRDIITRPAYDIYHHFLFKRLTLAGLLLIAGTAFGAWRALADDPLRWHARLWLAVAAPVLALGGVLLTVTNVETLALTSLAFLVGAASLWAASVGRLSAAARRVGGVALAGASVLWSVVGGYAAWEGSRVMFGAAEPQRASFVRLEDPSPSLTYLRGVRLDAGLYNSLRLTAAELDRLRQERGNLANVLFGPAMEWMERAYPESVLRGMPVWYHHGTALRPDDGPWLQERLASRQIDHIVLDPAWESWPGSFSEFLAKHYRQTTLGPVVRMYEARRGVFPPTIRPLPPAQLRPLAFCRRTHSNIHINVTQPSPGMAFATSPWGDLFGGDRRSRWDWKAGLQMLRGTFVAVLAQPAEKPVTASWRVLATGSAGETVLESGDVSLSAERPEARVNFELTPYGDSLRFEIEIADEDAGRLFAGWRDLWITQAGPDEPQPPPAAVDGCEDEHEEELAATTFLRHARCRGDRPEGAWQPAPFEAWRECGAEPTPWTVRVSAKRRHDLDGSPTMIVLVWYKGGRIEILREAMVNPADEQTVELQGWMPEAGGWMGVFARAADVQQPPNCRVKIESWAP